MLTKRSRWTKRAGWGLGLAFAGASVLLMAAVPPAQEGSRGAVAADHILSSRAGIQILKQGGNAVDAACAATFSQGVVNPAGSGLGGGGFMLLKHPKLKRAVVIDFREVAPAKAHAKMYLKKGLPRTASRTGGLAVGVPGELMGCAYAVKTYGKLPLKKVLAPAIAYASKGFPVGYHLAYTLKKGQKRFLPQKGLAPLFFPGGKALALRATHKRPRLAKTLKAIAAKGPKVFYEGWIAKDIVKSVKKAGGILSLQDLKTYKIKLRKPLQTTFRGHTIYSMPPPSSGGIVIIQALNILRRQKLASMGHNSSTYLHYLTEAFKHAFADRARFLGDPDFVKIPQAKLTSQKYADELAKRIGQKVLPKASDYGMKQKAAKAPPPSRRGTSHISVIDKDGFAVAVTSTINTAFGSQVVAEKSGVILNNQMADFTARPGKPNVFGLIQGKNNSIAPGKRPLSSMSPTLVFKSKEPVLSLGASGGPTIITGTIQALLNTVEFKLPLAPSVSRSRIHHQWMPPLLFVESDLPRDVTQALKARGHRIKVFPKPFTSVQAVQRKKGRYYGASDPRKAGGSKAY